MQRTMAHISLMSTRLDGGIDVINVFLRFNVFFYIFHVFLFKKLANAKYEYAKTQQRILLEDALAMVFIDFGLLRSPYCKISYLLADMLKFDNLHMMSVRR